MLKKKNLWKILFLRYKFTFKDDYLRVKEYFSYYWENPWTIEDILRHYPWDLLLLMVREVFRWTFIWPFMLIYCSFTSLVRYTFVLWHWVFVDIILYYLANKEYKYPFKFFRFIYRTGSWIEKFIINYFGIGLFFPWVQRKIDAIPDWIDRHTPGLIRGTVKLVETILWIARKYDRGFDYIVSFFDPWSYRKTRYMLSRKYRARVWLIFKWHRGRFRYFMKLQPLRLKGYGAIWIYRLKVLRVEIKFFLRSKVIKAYWIRYYYVYWRGFKLFVSENLTLLASWCWQYTPFIFYGPLSLFYWSTHLPFKLAFPFYRLVHNNYFSLWWRWSKKETKTVRKKIGRWKMWHSVWKQWAARQPKSKK